MTTRRCRCQCECDDPATTRDDGGNDVCEACAIYTVHDGETYCSRVPGGDGETCHMCGRRIRWHRIETHRPGDPNTRSGTCACGEEVWHDSDRGGWGHYEYESTEDRRARRARERERLQEEG